MFKKSSALLVYLIFYSQLVVAKEFFFVAHEFPPISFLKDSSAAGGMIDVLQMACKQLGHKCRVEIHPLARAFKMAENKEIHGVLSLHKIPERAINYADSPEIIKTTLVYMGLKVSGAKPIASPQELVGRTVLVTRGTATQKLIQKHAEQIKDLKVLEDVDSATMISKFINGKYEANFLIASTEEVLKSISQKNGIELVTLYTIAEKPLVISFVKKKMDEGDIVEFNKVLNKMKKDGSIKKILTGYNLTPAE